MGQTIKLGRFNKVSINTYAECKRVYLDQPSENGLWSACVHDGVFYLLRKSEDGEYKISGVYSTFTVEIEV